ncbi:MAG TPA: gamma-glutamyl-gamma-aminobutyrate hydrolase family protein [Firmicutes bacterium]|nr:gamma-glutamyl-gamma-aminobutyrate hydrolase family protein [Bacillota bacterium]
MKPVIGVTPLVDEERGSYWMIPGYMRALEKCGALPVMLPLSSDPDALARAAGVCAGFLFTGGQDVDPALYGEKLSPLCGRPCRERDAMDFALLSLCERLDIPAFGICRGIQIMNVRFGGTLHIDLPGETGADHCMKPPYDRVFHSVDILPGTPLARIVGGGRLGVNSYHHQAVKTLSPRLRAAAVSDDGIVEGAYMPGKKFFVGVQWHPELSYESDPASLALFGAFVSACENDRQNACDFSAGMI